MKTFAITTLVVLLLSFAPCYAQSGFTATAQVGASNIDGISYSSWAARLGFGYDLELSDQVALRPSIGLYLPGNRVKTIELEGGQIEIQRTANTRFISADFEAPIVLRPTARFGFFIGPYLAYRLHVQRNYDFSYVESGQQSQASYSENDTYLFKQLDFGFRAGIVCDISEQLWLSATFSQGLQQISVLGDFGLEQRHQAALLGIGLYLGRL